MNQIGYSSRIGMISHIPSPKPMIEWQFLRYLTPNI